MFCVGCGRSSFETQLVGIDSLCPELKSCTSCMSRYPGAQLRDESHRQLIYNRHGIFPAIGVKCKMCGEKKCLWNSDGSQNLLCHECNAERIAFMVKSGVLG